VIEADEYDTAFCDKRSKFVHYHLRTLILNNLEFDHADIFDDLAAIERQFQHLVRTLPASGRIVCNRREASLQRVLARGCWTPVTNFNDAASFQATGDDADDSLILSGAAGEIARTTWNLSGDHNRANACAALARFQNVRRRLELRGAAAGAPSMTISPIIQPPLPSRWLDCAARSAARASSPYWNRVPTP
jgi:UDP-N-acetylmuramate: L-alanyl-gamma-D-glutamyl-meso-diaminopimelate ligase